MTKEELRNHNAFQLLRSKLLEIFRVDKSDLDFGIYRVINKRRKVIEDFIDGDFDKSLLGVVHSTISNLKSKNKQEKIIQTFNDLYNFFSRYYEDGDFITQFRISSDGFKCAIPFNGRW